MRPLSLTVMRLVLTSVLKTITTTACEVGMSIESSGTIRARLRSR